MESRLSNSISHVLFVHLAMQFSAKLKSSCDILKCMLDMNVMFLVRRNTSREVNLAFVQIKSRGGTPSVIDNHDYQWETASALLS